MFSIALGQNWTLKIKFWLYHFIVILSSISCSLCPCCVHQNPEDVYETYRAGYVILHGSFGEQQLLTTTGTSSSEMCVFSFILNISIIRILLKCHLPSLVYIRITTMQLKGLGTLGTFIQMRRHFCDSEPLFWQCNCIHFTHFFLHFFLQHILPDCTVEANKSTEWLKLRKQIVWACWTLKYIIFSKWKTEFGNRRREETILAPLEEVYVPDYNEDSEVVSCNRVKKSVAVHTRIKEKVILPFLFFKYSVVSI